LNIGDCPYYLPTCVAQSVLACTLDAIVVDDRDYDYRFVHGYEMQTIEM